MVMGGGGEGGLRVRISTGCLAVALRVIGAVTMVAFAAAVMPQTWIIGFAQWLGFDPFPDAPLTHYLARNLSLIYGFVGALVWWIGSRLDQYRSLVSPLAWAVVAFGVGRAVVDTQAGMPLWWTAGESISSIVGGLTIVWFDRVATDEHSNVTVAGRRAAD